MIVTKLKGGLGNQLFEYALARRLSLERKSTLLLDASGYMNDSLRSSDIKKFNIKGSVYENQSFNSLVQIGVNLGFLKNYKEKETFTFDKDVLATKGSIFLDGYWQNYNYFSSITDILKEEFTIKDSDEKNEEFVEKIRNSSNAVCVHVRRGDIAKNSETNKIHGLMQLDYYLDSIKLLEDKISNPTFYVFSDDLTWVRENIKQENVVVVDINSIDAVHKDFMLMRSCQHFIIPNSTLSWWAAWLEGPKGIVIAPNKWLASRELLLKGNLVPENWILK